MTISAHEVRDHPDAERARRGIGAADGTPCCRQRPADDATPRAPRRRAPRARAAVPTASERARATRRATHRRVRSAPRSPRNPMHPATAGRRAANEKAAAPIAAPMRIVPQCSRRDASSRPSTSPLASHTVQASAGAISERRRYSAEREVDEGDGNNDDRRGHGTLQSRFPRDATIVGELNLARAALPVSPSLRATRGR